MQAMLLQSFLAAQTDAWQSQAKLAVRKSFLYLLELKKVLLLTSEQKLVLKKFEDRGRW